MLLSDIDRYTLEDALAEHTKIKIGSEKKSVKNDCRIISLLHNGIHYFISRFILYSLKDQNGQKHIKYDLLLTVTKKYVKIAIHNS